VWAGAAAGLAGWALFLASMADGLIRETRETMGKARRFKREKKLYQLQFEADELDGFECIASGTTLRRFIEITALSEELKTPEGRTKENVEKQFSLFAEYLVSWNLDDDDDVPIPCTFEGLQTQEFDLVMAIMAAWMQAIATVPDDLGKDSGSGETYPEESRLQLASLSESRAS
jgi:hypothetical protein